MKIFLPNGLGKHIKPGSVIEIQDDVAETLIRKGVAQKPRANPFVESTSTAPPETAVTERPKRRK